MHPVATRAVGHHDRAELLGQAVVAVQVAAHPPTGETEFPRQPFARVALGTGGSGDRLLRDTALWVNVRKNRVDAVAIGADGHLRIPAGGRLSVNAPAVGGGLLLVTLATGLRDVLAGDPRPWVPRKKKGVDAVTIGADRGLRLSPGDGPAMNTLLVGEKGTCGKKIWVLADEFLIPVTLTAKLRNAEAKSTGFGVQGSQNVMRSVAVCAIGRSGRFSPAFRED